MRSYSFKQYYGSTDKSVPHKANGKRVYSSNLEYDESWTNVVDGYRVVTVNVPKEFDIAYRYLRLHGLSKYVSDYKPFLHNIEGWGWYIEVGKSIMLYYRNPSSTLNEPTSTLVAPFRTRQQRKHAMKMITMHINAWIEERKERTKK